jgi:hypothetical protein
MRTRLKKVAKAWSYDGEVQDQKVFTKGDTLLSLIPEGNGLTFNYGLKENMDEIRKDVETKEEGKFGNDDRDVLDYLDDNNLWDETGIVQITDLFK